MKTVRTGMQRSGLFVARPKRNYVKKDGYQRTGDDPTVRHYIEGYPKHLNSFERWAAQRRAGW